MSFDSVCILYNIWYMSWVLVIRIFFSTSDSSWSTRSPCTMVNRQKVLPMDAFYFNACFWNHKTSVLYNIYFINTLMLFLMFMGLKLEFVLLQCLVSTHRRIWSTDSTTGGRERYFEGIYVQVFLKVEWVFSLYLLVVVLVWNIVFCNYQ